METKFTKGEWVVMNEITGSVFALPIKTGINEPKPFMVASVYPEPGNDEMFANAKLIAAAPDMLSALLLIQEILNEIEIPNRSAMSAAKVEIDYAIKKATTL